MNINIKDKRLIVGFSGGKDSTALICWLIDQGYEFEAVFCDTGWEHPETYKYIDMVNAKLLKDKLKIIKPQLNFKELVQKKKMFPSRKIRYCTQLLKIEPLRKYINAPNFDCVMVNGERAEESPKRAGKPEFEKDEIFGAYFWRPFLHKKATEIIEMHALGQLLPNPLYYLGHSRVGCYPCIYANKAEYKAISKNKFGKKRIKEIEELEKKLGIPWVIIRRTNYDISGIKELIKWSGADQLELFASPSCSSFYNLCE